MRMTRYIEYEDDTLYRVEFEGIIVPEHVNIKFEIGKFYRHTTGFEIAILGCINTIVFGEMLLAEQNDSPYFITVGSEGEYTIGFIEISRDEWMMNCNKVGGKE
jgi:hypothetical protein